MENKKYFFKIIVPNYNNYIYIKKCLDSILNQTFTDWHCIVVDDLSTDNSDKIAEIYAKRYPDKFTFLRMKEKGHEGGCRNYGIDFPINCEYYYFIDSDDLLYSEHSLQKIYINVKNDFPDVLLFKMIEEKNNKERIIPQPKFDWKSNLLSQSWNSACTKVVRSNKIQKFLENCDHAADSYQWMKVLDQKPSIKETNDLIYRYIRHQSSITQNGKYDTDKELFYNEYIKLMLKCVNEDVIRNMKIRINSYSKTCKMFKQTMVLKEAYEMCKKYNLLSLKKKKIVIIGANPSIEKFKFQNIIDSDEYFVIRLNRKPFDEYFQNYGSKTDLFIGQNDSKYLLNDVSNKIILKHEDILNLSKYFNLPTGKHLTTGFIVILMMLSISDNVNIFGFGSSTDIETGELYKSIYETHQKTRHLLDNEHFMLKNMIKKDFKMSLKRLEDM